MTGQVEFDSHRSAAVAVAMGMINELAPGHRRGKPFGGPTDDDLIAATARVLDGTPWEPASTAAEVWELRGWAVRLHEVIALIDAGEVDDAAPELNAIMREVGTAPVLSKHDDEPWHLHFHPEDAPWAAGWAAGMTASLAIIMGNPVIDRLGICTAPACDRAYLDTSRNGTKRFCSTACQNRVKAAAYRARHPG